MSKLPYVERPKGYSIGLTGECAYVWALFLSNEANMEDDHEAYDRWRVLVDQLKPAPNKPTPAGIWCNDLEDAIERYTHNDSI